MTDSDSPADPLVAADAAAAAWDARLVAMRDQPAYRSYERTRRRVLALLSLGRNRRLTGHAPSDYWSGELAKFEYMLDASPLIIEKLRHHTHNLTGLHANQYRDSLRKYRRRFQEKLEALRALDEVDLWNPEPRPARRLRVRHRRSTR